MNWHWPDIFKKCQVKWIDFNIQLEKASSKDTENTRDAVSNENDPRRGSESRSNHWKKREKTVTWGDSNLSPHPSIIIIINKNNVWGNIKSYLTEIYHNIETWSRSIWLCLENLIEKNQKNLCPQKNIWCFPTFHRCSKNIQINILSLTIQSLKYH